MICDRNNVILIRHVATVFSAIPAKKRGNGFLVFMLRKSQAFACTKRGRTAISPFGIPHRKMFSGNRCCLLTKRQDNEGPACLIAALTSKRLKFSTKSSIKVRAFSSCAAVSAHALRGFNKLASTPVMAVGTSN